MKGVFTIQKLRQFAACALSLTDYQPADSARVRAVPDVRTIRYYTTIGLIDRPAEMRGRTALYGQRHIEQLVAIKRLQSEGLSLSDIQHRLIGIPAKDLKKLANLPKDLQSRSSAAESAKSDTSGDNLARKSARPAFDDGHGSEVDQPWARVPSSRRQPVSPLQANSVTQIIRLVLSPSVSIDLKPNQASDFDFNVSDLDLEKVRQSAQPLLQELQRQQVFLNRKHEGEAPQ